MSFACRFMNLRIIELLSYCISVLNIFLRSKLSFKLLKFLRMTHNKLITSFEHFDVKVSTQSFLFSFGFASSFRFSFTRCFIFHINMGRVFSAIEIKRDIDQILNSQYLNEAFKKLNAEIKIQDEEDAKKAADEMIAIKDEESLKTDMINTLSESNIINYMAKTKKSARKRKSPARKSRSPRKTSKK
jgi:hypothetical protein